MYTNTIFKTLKFAPAVFALAVLAGCGENSRSSSSTTSPSDTPTVAGDNTNVRDNKSEAADSFIRDAAQANMAEVRTGKLAESHAASADVKNFGKHMADDHSTNLQKLKDLAAKKGYTLPSDVKEKDASTYAQLEKLNGQEFDRAYMNAMVADHRKDVAEFEKAASTARDSDVKSYANETLPTLRQHLQMAEETNRRVANPSATSSEKSAQTPTEVSHPDTQQNNNQNAPETSR
jgi:putative membrane protein